MKRKYLAIIYLLLLSIGTIFSLYMPKNEAIANDAVVIPSDAIRLRILANSDSAEDQALKRLVRDEVNLEITKWVAELTSKEEARDVIQAGLPEIEKIAKQVVAEQNSAQEVKVEFGQVEFPTKLYGEFLYPAGEYEAILITLGDGVGANWWCVLFPPLCFLDFSNGVAVSDGFDESETVAKAEAAELDNEKVTKDPVKESKKETTEAGETEDTGKEEPAKKEAVELDGAPEKSGEEMEKEKAGVTAAERDEKEDLTEEKSKAEINKEQLEKVERATIEQNKAETKQEPVFAAEKDEVEVRFFIKEVWDKIFG